MLVLEEIVGTVINAYMQTRINHLDYPPGKIHEIWAQLPKDWHSHLEKDELLQFAVMRAAVKGDISIEDLFKHIKTANAQLWEQHRKMNGALKVYRNIQLRVQSLLDISKPDQYKTDRQQSIMSGYTNPYKSPKEILKWIDKTYFSDRNL